MGLGARLHGLLKDEASITTFTRYICLSPGMPLMREQGSSLQRKEFCMPPTILTLVFCPNAKYKLTVFVGFMCSVWILEWPSL